MTPSRRRIPRARIVVALSFALPACLSPAGSSAVPATGAQAGASTPSPVGAGRRLVLWDGAHPHVRNVGMGRTGRMVFWEGGGSWAECSAKPGCTASLAATPGAGVAAHEGLKFHAEGPGWIGSGWSWFDWSPPSAGSDLSRYKKLTFQIRVESTGGAPEPTNLSVALVSNGQKRSSAQAPVEKYDARFDDGQWHKIAIPLADFTSGSDARDFDPTMAWEVRLSTWSASSQRLDVYVDQIAAEN
jgi:hypothetical protein